ncbi:MAG: 2-C-methyl-D-erythritol 4-phosphate cytidylyltransferase [Planctomycetes bacterium]|nr:2-C-methyl-D-erythritol 4-phosphate cytidylyltransferase [Planctomycetota bacterium]
MPQFAVILPAAGRSSRFHDRRKKQFTELDGRAVWVRAAELFINRDDVCQTIVAITPEDREEFSRRFGANLAFMGVEVVDGGAERVDSVMRALEKVRDSAEFVAIHDAVRPCLMREDIDKVFEAAQKTGAAVLATPIRDTLKKGAQDGTVMETVSRERLWAVQTPQVFRRDVLLKAYANRARAGKSITDDSQLVEATGTKVTLVEGPVTNIKITTRQDLILAKAILEAMPKPKVQGPIHPFAEDKMW